MNILKALVVIYLASMVIACGGAEERKAAYMEKADQSFNAGDYEKARIELKNVLQIDPKDDPAYFKLGKVFEKKKDFSKAFGSYLKAAELNPDNLEYQAKLGQFYLLSGDIDKAEQILNSIQEKDKNSVSGLLLKIGILIRQKKVEEAKNIAQSIFDKQPDNIESTVILASLYNKEKNYNAAINVLDEAIKADAGNHGLLTMLANNLFLAEDFDRAEQVLNSIVQQYPDVFANHVNLVKFYITRNNKEKAESILRSALDLEKDNIERNLTLINFIQETKGNEQAINELRIIINNNPNVGSFRLGLAQLYIAGNNIEEAIATYKSAINDFSEEETGITSRVQLARIYMQEGDIESAIDVIDDAMEIAPNDSELNLVKAKIELNNNNIDQAIISLRNVIKDNPQKIDAYLLLVSAHNANNENDQASDVLNRAYENNRTNHGALLILAKYHFVNKNLVDAEKVIDGYIRLDENNYEALSIKISILNSKNSIADAYDLSQKLIGLYPNKENGYIQSAPMLLSNDEPDKAIDLLKTGYQKTSSSQILKLMAEIQIATGKSGDAIIGLEALKDKDESIQLLLAKAYAANKDMEATKKTLLDSIMQDKTRTRSYISLATVHSSEGDNNKAISVLQDGVNANPDDVRLGITLAGFYERTGKIDSAIQQYETILADNADNLLANNNLAALLSDHKTDDASLKRAKEIADKLKEVNQPVIQDTVGWVYYHTGNYANAVSVLEKVIAAQPDIQVFNYHMGMAYHKSGNNTEARKYLEAALATDKEFQGRAIAEKTLKSL